MKQKGLEEGQGQGRGGEKKKGEGGWAQGWGYLMQPWWGKIRSDKEQGIISPEWTETTR